MPICEFCLKKCKIIPYGTCVIRCYFYRKDLKQFTNNHHLIYFLKNREIGM